MKNISNLGKPLTKKEQKEINGGNTGCQGKNELFSYIVVTEGEQSKVYITDNETGTVSILTGGNLFIQSRFC